MTVRYAIFYSKRLLKGKEFSISEHLTSDNLELLAAAKDKYGTSWSSDCKIYALAGNEKKYITSHADLNDPRVPRGSTMGQLRPTYNPYNRYNSQYPLPRFDGPRYPINPQPSARIDFDRNRGGQDLRYNNPYTSYNPY